jgi:Serine/threonine protein kinase
MTYPEFQQRYQYNTSTDRLGGGGFGDVFKAYDTHRDRWIAIKIAKVLPGLESIRLKKEVEMVGELPSHPNIAYYEECYTYSSFDGEYDFGILQYYEEGNLLDLLKKGNLTQEQKYNILTQILSGLDFLHTNGIIHRDLKPQNILIVKRGNDYIPKITDFGISKKLNVNKSSVFSNSIAGAGTLAYSSPEQLGDRTIRKNTDLWSFGVIAYQVLAGELPFTTGVHGNTSEAGRQELFSQINSGKLPERINMVEEPWQKLIKSCLVSDAERRVKDCGGCREVLKGKTEEINEEPVIVEEKTIIEELPSVSHKEESIKLRKTVSDKRKKSRKWPKAVLLILVLGLISIVGFYYYIHYEDSSFMNRTRNEVIALTGEDKVFWGGLSDHSYVHLYEDCSNMPTRRDDGFAVVISNNINTGTVQDAYDNNFSMFDRSYIYLCSSCEDRKQENNNQEPIPRTYDNKGKNEVSVSGLISKKQITDSDADFMYMYWAFEDKGKNPVAKSEITAEKFNILLPPMPQQYLEFPSNFLLIRNEVETNNNNVRIGMPSFFLYSSISSEVYSGDLFPQDTGCTGYYVYADGDVDITGDSNRGVKLYLHLKKGWNSVVEIYEDDVRKMIVQKIPYQWRWAS